MQYFMFGLLDYMLFDISVKFIYLVPLSRIATYMKDQTKSLIDS